MLNCIIDTILPKARMNWPSTPVLVHAPQHDFRVVRGQNFHEQPVGFRILAQLRVDELQRTRHGAHCVG